MKKPSRTSRPSLDSDHLSRLHQGAITELMLLIALLTTANEASGELRDRLDRIAEHHTNSYLTLIHSIGLHDQSFGSYFTTPPPAAGYAGLSRLLRIRLSESLILYHRRQDALLRSDKPPIYSEPTIKESHENFAELVRLLAT